MMVRQSTIILLGTLLGLLTTQTIASDDKVGLASMMGQLQVYLQKLDLSIQNDNADLIGFYIHELEESAEAIEGGIESYDVFPVGALTGSMLTPTIVALEKAVESDGDVDAAFHSLLDSCNACHVATDHGYIKITHMKTNPFNQAFD